MAILTLPTWPRIEFSENGLSTTWPRESAGPTHATDMPRTGAQVSYRAYQNHSIATTRSPARQGGHAVPQRIRKNNPGSAARVVRSREAPSGHRCRATRSGAGLLTDTDAGEGGR